ncbi:MAG: Ppx/GppA phosphatase family [Actinomycetia bacterium]|nr:Ppx/GppA phosphatase family [Actinomycetes bacterium]
MSDTYAGLDLGTNSTRLLIAEVDRHNDGPPSLRTLERRMTITRMGQGVNATRRLRPDAIERTLAVLRGYRELLDAHGLHHARATTTSAARDAENRDELFVPAREVLGFDLELISGDEEARLSFLGATAELDAPAPYLVVDIGGGSTEFVLGSSEPVAAKSIDVGCVRITEQFLASDPPAPEELSNAVAVVRDYLADVDHEMPGLRDAPTLVGLAGTVSAVASIELGLATYDRDRIHHFHLTHAAAEDVFRTLATESLAERRYNPGLEPERADVIVGGALILVSIFRHFGFDEMLVSEADILDGLVRSQL